MTIRELAEYLKVSEKAAYRHAVGGAPGGYGAARSTGGSRGSPPGKINWDLNSAGLDGEATLSA